MVVPGSVWPPVSGARENSATNTNERILDDNYDVRQLLNHISGGNSVKVPRRSRTTWSRFRSSLIIHESYWVIKWKWRKPDYWPLDWELGTWGGPNLKRNRRWGCVLTDICQTSETWIGELCNTITHPAYAHPVWQVCSLCIDTISERKAKEDSDWHLFAWFRWKVFKYSWAVDYILYKEPGL